MRVRALGLFVLSIVGPAIHGSVAAQEEEQRAPSESVLPSIFSWTEPVPAPLRQSLRAYRHGRFFDTLAHLEAFANEGTGEDDSSFVRALALRGLGWDDLSIPLLRSVVESRPPGPYYPHALLELVEIHSAADRPGVVADAFLRYFEKPLRRNDSDSRRITRLLFEFGTLRSGRAKLSPKEKQLLANPEELAVRLENERDRASDRVLYLSGVALLRLKRHPESLRALHRIGIESPYYPYGLYTIAQNLFALGETRSAVKMLDRLIRYPEPRRFDRALESRARILKARMLLESGALDRGIRVATSLPADDPDAESARLLIAEALVDAEQPALALAYAGDAEDGEGTARGFELAARRGLALGFAYADLGDAKSAAQVLRKATRRVHRARLDDSDEGAQRLGALARSHLDARLRRESERRNTVSAGVDRIIAHEKWGSWNFGRLVRGAGVVLGLRPHAALARGMKADTEPPAGRDDLWIAYLRSPHRARVELFLTRVAELDDGTVGARESCLRILNAHLTWLEHGSDAAKPGITRAITRRAEAFTKRLREAGVVPPLEIDPATPLAPQLAAYRRALAADPGGTIDVAPEALNDVREETAALLQRRAEEEVRRFLESRATARKRIERDLEMALVDVLAEGAGAAAR